jgi:hypothetical protein
MPDTLKVRIRKFLEYQLEQQAGKPTLKHQDVKILKLLSPNLSAELKYYRLRAPLVNSLPLQLLDTRCNPCFRLIATMACMEMHVAAGDALVTYGEACESMFVVLEGKVKYTDPALDESRCLKKDALISEIALLVRWTHRGGAVALSTALLLVINVDCFLRAVETYDSAKRLVAEYGRKVLEYARSDPPQLVMFGDCIEEFPGEEELFESLAPDADQPVLSPRSDTWHFMAPLSGDAAGGRSPTVRQSFSELLPELKERCANDGSLREPEVLETRPWWKFWHEPRKINDGE